MANVRLDYFGDASAPAARAAAKHENRKRIPDGPWPAPSAWGLKAAPKLYTVRYSDGTFHGCLATSLRVADHLACSTTDTEARAVIVPNISNPCTESTTNAKRP